MTITPAPARAWFPLPLRRGSRPPLAALGLLRCGLPDRRRLLAAGRFTPRTPLTATRQVFVPRRGAALDVVANFLARRQIGRRVAIVAALFVAQRQQRDLVGVKLVDDRGLRLGRMRHVRNGYLDSLRR